MLKFEFKNHLFSCKELPGEVPFCDTFMYCATQGITEFNLVSSITYSDRGLEWEKSLPRRKLLFMDRSLRKQAPWGSIILPRDFYKTIIAEYSIGKIETPEAFITGELKQTSVRTAGANKRDEHVVFEDTVFTSVIKTEQMQQLSIFSDYIIPPCEYVVLPGSLKHALACIDNFPENAIVRVSYIKVYNDATYEVNNDYALLCHENCVGAMHFNQENLIVLNESIFDALYAE